MVECSTVNRNVVGSIPTSGAKLTWTYFSRGILHCKIGYSKEFVGSTPTLPARFIGKWRNWQTRRSKIPSAIIDTDEQNLRS